ncbi:O-antigen polymerase [Priestia megaterium]|uniref:O-antigen polymerase n=1 Tax=Priestia megaterium TaxID=1404 RepID=UPI002116DD93|nr:O-antigen polymerase [Priestia megaterium]
MIIYVLSFLLAIVVGGIVPFALNSFKLNLYVEGSICLTILFFVIVISMKMGTRILGEFDIFSPFIIPNILFLVIYVFKPLYIIITGEAGVGTFNVHNITENEMVAFNTALLYVLIGVLTYNGTLYYLLNFKTNNIISLTKIKMTKKFEKVVMNSWIKLIAIISLVFTVFILGFLIVKAGGINTYINNLALRNVYLKDAGYILILANISKITLFIFSIRIIFKKNNISKREKFIYSMLLIFSVTTLLLTGGRSSILYGILTLIIIRHYFYQKVKTRNIIAIGSLLFFFIIIVYRIVLRDKNFASNSHLSFFEILSNAISDFPRYFFGGYDVIQFDALLTLLREKGTYNYLFGETILATILSPIPRSIFPEKGYGAMTRFTEHFFPEFYYPNHVEVNISFLGEMYFNFGLLGIIAGFLLFSIILGGMYRIFLINASGTFALVYAISIVRIISLLRGDLFNFYIFYMQDILPLLVIILMLKLTRRKSVVT